LYGDVAGNASSSDRIASAVAPAGVTPSVELDFSTSHGMFRVQRTPKHERGKRRGNGTTIEHASAKLWRLVSPDADSVGEPVSTRIDEIGAEIVDIVGLSRDQFVQTVVLPQGEFATFLRADAEHRRELLQRLFGTEVYDRTVDRLVEQRRVARQQRASAATSVLGAVRAYGGASGASAEDEDALVALLETDSEQLLVVMQQQLDAIAAAASVAKASAVEQARLATNARAELVQLQTRDRAKRRVIELQAQLHALDAGADELSNDIERFNLAEEAARIMPAIDGLTQARERAQHAQGKLDAARARLPLPDLAVDDWPDQERAVTSLVAELATYVELEQVVTEGKAQIAELQSTHSEVQQRLNELTGVVAATPDELADLRRRLTAAAAAQATLGPARDRLESSKRMMRAADELQSLSQNVDSVRQKCDEQRHTAQRLLRDEAALRSRFIDGMAGHLASQLRADEPCPVCGSSEHPRPAARAADDVERATVDAAAEATAAATVQLEASLQELAALESAAAELRGIVGGVSSAEALDLVNLVEAEVAAGIAAEAEHLRLQKAVADAEEQLSANRGKLLAVQQQSARLEASIEIAEKSLQDDERRIAAAAGDHATVTARVHELEKQAALWRTAIDALGHVAAAQGDVEVRSAEVAVALDASCFATSSDVHEAFLAIDQRHLLSQSIQLRRSARAACEGELGSPELSRVDVAEMLDLEAATEAVEMAELALQEAQGHDGRFALRVAESRARAAEVQTSLSAQRAVDKSTAAVIRMADLVSASTADNAKSMSLPTFVLRERFVDVVASANSRLATMSDGRFRLEHVEGKRGNGKSGLELQVRDTHTEHPRSPATLSGGESFYCSLALALGLADVVTSEAGGVDLGTLFVDEGFGSLDPDTLDQVLEVLQGLATSGRAVGIVSHVPELKEQVAERISVVPNRDGSSRLIVAA
ncbi:MAG: SbcC/MukB-like Walker B domain-containing protein, partial [Actinomycetes bacterium]